MIFKVILCYNNGSTEILNQFNDELMAIKFTYDMIEDNLSKINLKYKPSHLLIEKHEEKTNSSRKCEDKVGEFLQNFRYNRKRAERSA